MEFFKSMSLFGHKSSFEIHVQIFHGMYYVPCIMKENLLGTDINA